MFNLTIKFKTYSLDKFNDLNYNYYEKDDETFHGVACELLIPFRSSA